MFPHESNGQTNLEGQADLEVKVELPTALMFAPKAFLERAGNKLLKSVLIRIKNKLTTQLSQDYRTWASEETKSHSQAASKLSPDLGF